MKLYCYHLAPIDFWCGALTEAQMNASVDAYHQPENRASVRRSIAKLKARASAAFLTIGWEGDVAHGPFYFGVPGDSEMTLGYIVKQSNNGSCFVASPVPLSDKSVSIVDQTIIDE